MLNEIPPFFSFIILSYNRSADVIFTINQIINSDFNDYEIIVVDNGSSDYTSEQITRVYGNFKKIHLIKIEKNIGIAGWNYGAEMAKGEYLWFLDDDSNPVANSIKKAFEIINSEKILAIACRVEHFPGASGLIISSENARPKVKYFCGCGAIVKKDIFKKLHGFWPEIFVYSHEMEFGVRLYNMNVPIYYINEIVVNHRAEARASGFKYYHTRKSLSLIYYRYLPITYSFAYSLTRFLMATTSYLKNSNFAYAKEEWKGFKDASIFFFLGKVKRYKLDERTKNDFFFAKGFVLND